MDNRWASENLQVIRTLMERAALYRRALAPIMTVAGIVGLIGATIPCFVTVSSNRAFSLFWMAVSMVAMLGSFLLVRRQALKDSEPVWSPPTRRVTRALLPAFCAGLAAGVFFAWRGPHFALSTWMLSSVWMVCYGCGLHAAGFFTMRGIRLFGWIFVAGGLALFGAAHLESALQSAEAPHYIMGIGFGCLHLAYGIYLYFTEKSRQSA